MSKCRESSRLSLNFISQNPSFKSSGFDDWIPLGCDAVLLGEVFPDVSKAHDA